MDTSHTFPIHDFMGQKSIYIIGKFFCHYIDATVTNRLVNYYHLSSPF